LHRRRLKNLRKIGALLLVIGLTTALTLHVKRNLRPERNDVAIFLDGPKWSGEELRVAVLGDLHLAPNDGEFKKLAAILEEVSEADPDLIVFVGDYSIHRDGGLDIDQHRARILKLLKSVSPLPYAAVLGNYETYSWHHRWMREARYHDVNVLDNEVQVIETRRGPVCVRGLSDFWTKQFRYIAYSKSCDGLRKFSITHDPAAAFQPKMDGLVIAGHTHCGQVSLPVIGPIWVPTTAPKAARCGLYRDNTRTVFVTSGIGTSILPIRFGAPAQWDLLVIKSRDSK